MLDLFMLHQISLTEYILIYIFPEVNGHLGSHVMTSLRDRNREMVPISIIPGFSCPLFLPSSPFHREFGYYDIKKERKRSRENERIIGLWI